MPVSGISSDFLLEQKCRYSKFILKEKKMETEENIHKLEAKGIKPTSNRILVMKTLVNEQNTLSLKDLEQKMVSMDKSSIFRTLTLFLEHDAVHAFDD